MTSFDLTGQRFNGLRVVGFSRVLSEKKLWNCICDCGRAKEVTTYHLRAGKVRTCGCKQRRNGYRRTPLELKRFLVSQIILSPSGCWHWTGRCNPQGYGLVSTHLFGGRAVGAHRLVAHLWLGLGLGDDRVVCHKCDNPKCVNPEHLFLGTQSQNIQDCVDKGRHRWTKLKATA